MVVRSWVKGDVKKFCDSLRRGAWVPDVEWVQNFAIASGVVLGFRTRGKGKSVGFSSCST